jgi:hypothetical protein
MTQKTYLAGETIGCLGYSQGTCNYPHSENTYTQWCCSACTAANEIQEGHFLCQLPPSNWQRIQQSEQHSNA